MRATCYVLRAVCGVRRGVAAAVLALLLAAPLAAQTGVVLPPEQEKVAQEAMSKLRSPYTAFHTVDMCPSAVALRDSIRVMVAAGMTAEQVVEEQIARHGEQIRLLPKRSGPGLWAWVIPPLVLLVGAGVVVAQLRRRHAAEPAPPPPTALSEAERMQLAAAMRKWDADPEVEL